MRNKAEGVGFSCPERQRLRKELLSTRSGVAGMIWHVGSDPDPDSLDSVVLTEVKRSGFLSWIQGGSREEGMLVAPFHHPELGLRYDEIQNQVTLDLTKAESLETALTSPEGLDFHPQAAPGWYQVLKRAKDFPSIRLLKTHLAAPSCTASLLDETVGAYLPLIYQSLLRGHLNHARQISTKLMVCLDDPQTFSLTTMEDNFTLVFGDRFDNGMLVDTETDVLRAIHCCGSWDILSALKTGALDLVHYDAWRYGSAPLVGQPEILHTFLGNDGLLAWGGIPQNFANLEELAHRLGLNFQIKAKDDLCHLADFLLEKIDLALNLLENDFENWLISLQKETGLAVSELKRRTFISATCGYSSNTIPGLRHFSYQLARLLADRQIC